MPKPLPLPIPHWRQSALGCPREWRDWLLASDSLTQRLRQHSRGDFSVTVIHQGWGKPRRDEALALGIPCSQYALIREVVLNGCGEPWVFARSVMPVNTLDGKLRFLRKLGNRPLGELLFRNPAIQRGPLWLARWPTTLLPLRIQQEACVLACHDPLWARYSIFQHQHAGILVSEVFLPTLRIQSPDGDRSSPARFS